MLIVTRLLVFVELPRCSIIVRLVVVVPAVVGTSAVVVPASTSTVSATLVAVIVILTKIVKKLIFNVFQVFSRFFKVFRGFSWFFNVFQGFSGFFMVFRGLFLSIFNFFKIFCSHLGNHLGILHDFGCYSYCCTHRCCSYRHYCCCSCHRRCCNRLDLDRLGNRLDHGLDGEKFYFFLKNGKKKKNFSGFLNLWAGHFNLPVYF